MRRLVAVVVLVAVGTLVACSPRPSADAKKRVATLAADPIRTLAPPGGQRLGESRDPGHKTQAPYGERRPTVNRDYTFAGDAKAAAKSVQDQGRNAGWFMTGDCDLAADGTYFVRGSKQLEDSTGSYRAGFEAQVWTRPAREDRPARQEVLTTISARYPGEDPSQLDGTRAPSATTAVPDAAASCLDD